MSGKMIGFPFVELPLCISISPTHKKFEFDEEDSYCRILNNVIVHPQLEDEEEINQEDFMGDEYSENARHR